MKKTKTKEFEMKMKFTSSDISNASLIHIKNTTAVVTHIYNAIQAFQLQDVKPLPTDSLPMMFDDGQVVLVQPNQKELTMNWIMRKAFEDFINAIFKSLKEAFKFVKFLDYCLKGEYQGPFEKTLKELEEIERDSDQDAFPKLIEKIEKLLKKGNVLEFKEEILSMNKVRNCLVHRDGTVKTKDTNNQEKSLLVLKFVSNNSYVKIDEEFERLTFERRKKEVLVKEQIFKELKEVREFKIGEEVHFDINDFNGISYCCYKFAIGLYNSCIAYQNKVMLSINKVVEEND